MAIWICWEGLGYRMLCPGECTYSFSALWFFFLVLLLPQLTMHFNVVALDLRKSDCESIVSEIILKDGSKSICTEPQQNATKTKQNLTMWIIIGCTLCDSFRHSLPKLISNNWVRMYGQQYKWRSRKIYNEYAIVVSYRWCRKSPLPPVPIKHIIKEDLYHYFNTCMVLW